MERGWDSNSEKDKRGGKKIFLLSFLPPNLLVIFISFYWLIFNTISFCFILFLFVFILALRLLLNPFLFVMVMAMSIHLIDTLVYEFTLRVGLIHDSRLCTHVIA
jgi:hypothetical protein